MRDVLGIDCDAENRRRFILRHTENSEQKSIEYEAASEYAAEQIATKIKYFMVKLRYSNNAIVLI